MVYLLTFRYISEFLSIFSYLKGDPTIYIFSIFGVLFFIFGVLFSFFLVLGLVGGNYNIFPLGTVQGWSYRFLLIVDYQFFVIFLVFWYIFGILGIVSYFSHISGYGGIFLYFGF